MDRKHGVFLALIALLLVAGCGNGTQDRAGLAAAKCSAPVAQRLDPSDSIQVQVQATDTQVTDLGNGRFQVTGTATVMGRGLFSYTCDVVPDPSDKLRGFRVTELQVQP